MKRMVFALMMIIMLAGCTKPPAETALAPEPTETAAANTENGAVETASEPPLVNAGSPEGFPFEYGGQTIYVGLPAEPIVAALGEPLQYFEAPSCAFEGIDKTYFYNGIELHTFPQGDKDYVLAVLFTDDSVETPEGVYIGMPVDDALAAYGDGYAENGGQYVYTEGGGTFSVFAENGVVSELSYNFITGE